MIAKIKAARIRLIAKSKLRTYLENEKQRAIQNVIYYFQQNKTQGVDEWFDTLRQIDEKLRICERL